MGKEDLIVCFEDTLEKSNSGNLKYRTECSVRSNRVYKEGFVSEEKHRKENATVDVYSGTTFDVAKRYCTLGKVAVLNFANPENPGGGVCIGAIAQEECLCRSSNLYACISNPDIFDEYYGYHRSIRSSFYTDRLIYTKNVTVFKDDSLVPQMLPENEWFEVDVITCAAPYLAKRKHTNGAALFELLKTRVKNIFEAARDNHADYLILGAFGCGAFRNPPLIVAEAFRHTIEEQNYLNDFKQIIFAIKPTGVKCPNLSTFSLQFNCLASDKNERAVKLPESLLSRFQRCPKLPDECRFDNSIFKYWQTHNKYFGKQFSVLGDSISTLDGFNPDGFRVFYSAENCSKSGVMEEKDTWWGKAIDFFGGELLVNNSWSGSRVTKLKNNEQLFPSGCSYARTSALHINNVKPDVILVYLGTNDWAYGVKLKNEKRIIEEDDFELFDDAYNSMLKKLKQNYPESEIWCCTLCETQISKRPDFKFPHEYAGTHIENYNEIIRKIVRLNKCRLIDLYDYKMAYDSIDGTHPSDAGMNTIATMVIRSMVGVDADRFLDCEYGQHEYKVAKESTDGTVFICSRCGKREVKNSLSPDEIIKNHKAEVITMKHNKNTGNENEYVMLDSNITIVLYDDLLRLTIESTGKTVQFRKNVVDVGRDKTCDLLLEGKPAVALHQATFFYEDNIWYLRDNFSTNGTWINGAKIQPGKKYQLASNDEINFAMSEKIIFYKHEHDSQPAGISDGKALAILEVGMSTLKKSDYSDDVSLKMIIAALTNAPLYFPVEIDFKAMLGSVDPAMLKPGDILEPDKDVKMRIMTMAFDNDTEVVPMFTSNDEAQKGPDVSVIRFYPHDYLPKLMQMDKPVIINPFSENRFFLSKQLITEVLLPLVQNKTKTANNVAERPAEKYIGKIIENKYEVLNEIGRGSFFTTYLVRDIRINKAWAMKICDKKNRHYSTAVREAILTEPYMMKKLEHPAIPNVVDIIEDQECIFIVREYVEGKTLETIVKTYGAQPADKVIEWGKQLCGILGYLHSQTPPHIYRDMKPANIILKPDGTIKIIDFGIMRTYKTNRNFDTCCLGTKGYAAPEQFGGSQTDARTDIFGLGMTMFRLVTGINPVEPPYEVIPICSFNPKLPKGLEYIISKCIQPNPDERYQSCDELLCDLNNYMRLPKSKRILGKFFCKK